MCFSFEELTDEYDRIIIFKEPVSDKALTGHVIRTEKVTDERSCRVECYLEANCVSVNVGPNDGGHHVCELNNGTDESPTGGSPTCLTEKAIHILALRYVRIIVAIIH